MAVVQQTNISEGAHLCRLRHLSFHYSITNRLSYLEILQITVFEKKKKSVQEV